MNQPLALKRALDPTSAPNDQLQRRQEQSEKNTLRRISGFDDFALSYSEFKKGHYESSLKALAWACLKIAVACGLMYASFHGISFLGEGLAKRKIEKLFINSNECNMKQVEEQLLSHSLADKKCHVGVSGWHNYDIAAITRPSYLIVGDVSKKTLDFHAASIEFLKSSQTREEFIQKMAKQLLSDSSEPLTEANFKDHFQLIVWDQDHPIKMEDYYKNSSEPLYEKVENALKMEMNRPGSWLFTEEKFRFIQKQAIDGKILSHSVNLVDPESFQSFSTKLNNVCSSIHTLYLSNAQDWIHSPQARKSFVSHIQSIADKQTFIIDAAIQGDLIYQKGAFREDWLKKQASD